MYEPYQPISVVSPTRRETPFYASSAATLMIWGAHLALFGPLRTLYNFVAILIVAAVSLGSLFLMFMWAPAYAPWLWGAGLLLLVAVPTLLGTAVLIACDLLGNALFRTR